MAKQLIGKAPLTLVRTTAKSVVYVYQGKPAPADITDADRKRLLERGYLIEVDVETDEPAESEKPAKKAASSKGGS